MIGDIEDEFGEIIAVVYGEADMETGKVRDVIMEV